MTTQTPKVSVVMTVLNREDFFAEAVESILNQTLEHFECIIIDDGSTDRTREMLSHYERLDPRIRAFSLPVNCGIATARNIGLKMARGEYVAVMDSDDIAMPTRLDDQSRYMDQNRQVSIAGGYVVKFNETSEILMKYADRDDIIKANLLRLDGSALIDPSTIMRRSILCDKEIGYHPLATDLDHALWIESMTKEGVFGSCETPVIRYRRHAGNVTNTPLLEMRKKPLRKLIINLFFPAASISEKLALENLFTFHHKTAKQSIFETIGLALNAGKQVDSVYGESRLHIQRLIKHTCEKILQSQRLSP